MPVEETVEGGTASGTGVEAGAAYRSAGAEAMSDIGQGEAYVAQIKRVVANELDLDQQLRQLVLEEARDAAAHRSRVRLMGEQLLANLMNQSQINSRESAENSRFGFDQLYPSMSNVISDALAAKVAKDVNT